MVYNWLKNAHSVLFPATCLICQAPGTQGYDLCADCLQSLPVTGPVCVRCAMPLSLSHEALCGACLRKPPGYDRCVASFSYDPPVDHIIQHFKFNGRLNHGRFLGEWMAESLADSVDSLPDCIIPVPLHAKRMRERGFNQALELARPIARCLGVPIDCKSVRRVMPTAPQMALPARERHNNIRGAFAVCEQFLAGHVAIVDDVVTTAATVNELARVLRKAGVQTVEVWCCARAT